MHEPWLANFMAVGGIFIALFLVVFAILGFLMPYFVYRISCKLTDIQAILQDIADSLDKTNGKDKSLDTVECASCHFEFSKKTFIDHGGICPSCNERMA